MSDVGTLEITQILEDWNQGNDGAKEKLLPFVYDELRRQARRMMSQERPDHTLQPTALVHEAFLRLARTTGGEWRDRHHFYAIAARVMRQILIEHARRVATLKRGGGAIHFSADEMEIPLESRAEALVALEDALTRLEEMDPQQAQIVELRFFGGMTGDEIADTLGISSRTVSRDWESARLWLFRELNKK